MMELNGQITLEQQLSGAINACGERGPAGKDAKMDLLWTNPSPNAAFAGQVVDVPNIYDYTALAVELGHVNAAGTSWNVYGVTQMGVTAGVATTVVCSCQMLYTGNIAQIMCRMATIDGTNEKITFSDGFRQDWASGGYGAPQTQNSAAKPIRIYGIK